MANRSDYGLGSIWLVSFDPARGTEIKKTRPALITSGTLFNQKRSKITILPITSVKVNDGRLSSRANASKIVRTKEIQL